MYHFPKYLNYHKILKQIYCIKITGNQQNYMCNMFKYTYQYYSTNASINKKDKEFILTKYHLCIQDDLII